MKQFVERMTREKKHFILHGVENVQEVNRIIQNGNICMM